MKMLATAVLVALVAGSVAQPATADGTYQGLPFSQAWTNIGLITVDDDWAGVPGIIGYRGDHSTAGVGIDPQTVLFDDTPANTGVATSPVVDVNANRAPAALTTFFTGGCTEWELADPVVALTGSGTADNPYIQIHINSTGFESINVSYLLRDIEEYAGSDNSIQPVALHFRTAASGPWTNVPTAFVADASIGPDLGITIPVAVVLPSAADNQPILQIRILTTNAAGNDEWIGVDEINITGTPISTPTTSATWGKLKNLYR